MNQPVKVDVWSDIACPWCFVGKRRFEAAASTFRAEGGEVEVEYHSYQLSPTAPTENPGPAAEHLARHLRVPVEQAEQMHAQMTELAASVGLAYDFDALQQTNTLLAHQLLHLAKTHGRQVDMKERLMSAHFEQGRHVGRIDELVDLAAEIGLDRDEVRAALTEGRYLADVDADRDQGFEYGINGVPFHVIDGRFAVSGAQEPAVFVDALRRAAGEPATTDV
jgi:predicted DsbA family dithiol-disulfide isomerase